jgi:hypothetical protein
MKTWTKQLFLLLVLTLSVLLAASVHATEYRDVGPGHWAYNAIRDISDQGLVEGYPDSKFHGNQPLTRNEAAVIVARLLDSGLRESPIMRRLAEEFSDELAVLHVKVSGMSDELKLVRKNQRDVLSRLGALGIGDLKVRLGARARFENSSFGTTVGKIANRVGLFLRTRLHLLYKPDRITEVNVVYQDENLMGSAKQNNNGLGAGSIRNLHIGNIALRPDKEWIDKFTFGRQYYRIGTGFFLENEIDGMLLEKDFRGYNFRLGAFDTSDSIQQTGGFIGANDGLDLKLFDVDKIWDKLTAGFFWFGQDRVETATRGNISGVGIHLLSRMGKDVAGKLDVLRISDAMYDVATRGGAVRSEQNGFGVRGSLDWKINNRYDMGFAFQNRKKDFMTLGHNDDYQESIYYDNHPLSATARKDGTAVRESYNNSTILSMFFGTDILEKFRVDFWLEKFQGDEVREDIYGKGTDLTGNFDQSAVQSVMTFKYTENTNFKLRYRSVAYDAKDPDYKILKEAGRPADYQQVRLDLNVSF